MGKNKFMNTILILFMISLSIKCSTDSGLIKAAKLGEEEKVWALIKEGENINKRDSYGLTALHYMAIYNDIKIARLLIEKGAKISLRSEKKIVIHSKEYPAFSSPLKMAEIAGNKKFIEFLKTYGISEKFQKLKSPMKIEKKEFQEKVLKTKGLMPEWLEEGNRIKDINGKKVIFFISYGSHEKKETSEINAVNKAIQWGNLAFSNLILRQIIVTFEKIDPIEKEIMRDIIKKIKDLSRKKIKIWDLNKQEDWWKKVTSPVIKNDKIVDWKAPYYNYYIQFSFSYKDYIALRDEIIRETIDATLSLNDKHRAYSKIMEILHGFDNDYGENHYRKEFIDKKDKNKNQ